jgi:hypothetical protein
MKNDSPTNLKTIQYHSLTVKTLHDCDTFLKNSQQKYRGKNRIGSVFESLNTAFTIVLTLLLVSLACNLPAKNPPADTLAGQVAQGNIRFKGTGNVTYIECQDPTATVTVSIGEKTKQLDGVEFYDFVNPVTVNTLTDGRLQKTDQCEKTSLGDKYDWPAKGIYYPKETRIVFTTCTNNNDKAEGEAHLVGDGFEGEYACYDKNNGGLIFKVAFSAYETEK